MVEVDPASYRNLQNRARQANEAVAKARQQQRKQSESNSSRLSEAEKESKQQIDRSRSELEKTLAEAGRRNDAALDAASKEIEEVYAELQSRIDDAERRLRSGRRLSEEALDERLDYAKSQIGEEIRTTLGRMSDELGIMEDSFYDAITAIIAESSDRNSAAIEFSKIYLSVAERTLDAIDSFGSSSRFPEIRVLSEKLRISCADVRSMISYRMGQSAWSLSALLMKDVTLLKTRFLEDNRRWNAIYDEISHCCMDSRHLLFAEVEVRPSDGGDPVIIDSNEFSEGETDKLLDELDSFERELAEKAGSSGIKELTGLLDRARSLESRSEFNNRQAANNYLILCYLIEVASIIEDELVNGRSYILEEATCTGIGGIVLRMRHPSGAPSVDYYVEWSGGSLILSHEVHGEDQYGTGSRVKRINDDYNEIKRYFNSMVVNNERIQKLYSLGR